MFERVLTRLDAERAHHLAVGLMRVAARLPGARRAGWRRLAPADPALTVEAMGLRFPGPLGLAAGFDKNAIAIDALGALGFGFVEVGTVTGRAQPGNPRPRLHRLLADRAIVNRMGFNNDGAAAVAARLAARRRRRGSLPIVVGVNIGKTKAVPDAQAISDYEASTRMVAPYADYLVVNVSSPNTPGLRDLQAVSQLRPLLTAVRAQADAVTDRRVPLVVKIAPDLSDDDVLAVADLALELRLDGIIATNTTVSRAGLSSAPGDIDRVGAGGLSGAPLAARALEVLKLLSSRLADIGTSGDDQTRGPGDTPDVALISVGGVSDARDVYERLQAGADLVQAYTAFIYGGASWPSRVHRELAGLLAHGVTLRPAERAP
ncbi:quinone-dependent dihydroorotate dehydrogenase [Phytoactinopolyspora alkaliphila]|uniref:Dihydroorotate dehydrogenase (quinone) n=1 Tax=Phytoactinopolyspora alkaliphila TaxID=1783498 RepID=A0A6N9YR96_9ACTN|nr:quinone-dependent dihydroorotate dehydrogenase [Phytoactinopolyspora alkaliphila]NED97504.1 quinone-dependent dihydroorotate dehydrogenase [Phytoactinopolyspora alkaliphila]